VGKETDDDLFVSDTKTVKVGTVASPSAITKLLRIPHCELVPAASGTASQFASGYAAPGTNSTFTVFRGSVVLPKGVTITAHRFRGYRNAVGDIATVTLERINTNDTVTALNTLTHATTGWATTSNSLSQLVGDEGYLVTVNLQGVVALDARYAWYEIDYTMPSYDKGI